MNLIKAIIMMEKIATFATLFATTFAVYTMYRRPKKSVANSKTKNEQKSSVQTCPFPSGMGLKTDFQDRVRILVLFIKLITSS